jgi:hypothetical protein
MVKRKYPWLVGTLIWIMVRGAQVCNEVKNLNRPVENAVVELSF